MKLVIPSSRARAPSTSKQQRPDSPALPVVDHRHCEVRHVRALAETHVARDADPLSGFVVNGDDRLVVVVIDVRQVMHNCLCQLGHRREETPVARLVAQAVEAVQQQSPVRTGALTHPDAGTIAERDYSLVHANSFTPRWPAALDSTRWCIAAEHKPDEPERNGPQASTRRGHKRDRAPGSQDGRLKASVTAC